MPDLVDFLSGAAGAQIFGHLTTSPLPSPPTLSGLVEAGWLGYAPAPFQPTEQAPGPAGWGTLAGTCVFSYLGSGPITVTGLYLTATLAGVVTLIYLQDLTGSAYNALRPGRNTFAVSYACFNVPAGVD